MNMVISGGQVSCVVQMAALLELRWEFEFQGLIHGSGHRSVLEKVRVCHWLENQNVEREMNILVIRVCPLSSTVSHSIVERRVP